MIRRISALFLGALLALSCSQVEDVDLPMAVAHRGCWLKDGEEFYINENCPAGVNDQPYHAQRFGLFSYRGACQGY